MTMIKEGKLLVEALRNELGVPAALRDTPVSDRELNRAMRVIEEMIATLQTGVLPPKERRDPNLGYAITDHWGYKAPLSERIIAFEQDYREL